MLFNAVLIAVLVMLGLSLARVHVVLSLFIGALVGGLLGGLSLDETMLAFQDGLAGGAKIALSYALLGAFAMAVANSGLPDLLARWIISKISPETSAGAATTAAGTGSASATARLNRTTTIAKYLMVASILAMSIMSQNLIPVHIAFIPLLIPPLLSIMNLMQLDRRLIACVLTFGLVTTYMYLPFGFGSIFLNDILLGNIQAAGMETSGINVMSAMGIPALGMLVGLLVAVFISYRKPRVYNSVAAVAQVTSAVKASVQQAGTGAREAKAKPVSKYKIVMSLVAIVACFAVQLWMNSTGAEADGLLIGALVGLGIFLLSGAVNWRQADDVFTQGMRMMALIGFIMISAQGFAAVMNATGQIEPLVTESAELFAGSKAMAAFAMLFVGLVITMGIGSSFSTLPIITAIYVPLCVALDFSPLATVALIGTAGALGDAGSPASDSTLGPTAGLNADGAHDHIRDSVIPTFIHFNIPLLLAGWLAALVL